MSKREVLKATSELKITVVAEKTIWTNEQNKAYQKLITELDLKGFRKGKVPVTVAKKHIKDADVWSAAIRPMLDILVKLAAQEIKAEDIVLDGPVYDVIKLTATELEIAFIYPIYPEVKLGQYKKLGLKYTTPEVSATEIAQELKQLQSRHALLQNKAAAIPIAHGDVVKFDFEGFNNGAPFEGGKAENYELEIGSGQFIPGFEEALLGLKVADQKKIDLTFPKTYHEKTLAGQPVTFEVKINEVKTKDQPALNDAFALEVNYPGIKTLAELKSYFQDTIQQRKEQQAKTTFKDEAFAKIKKGMEFRIPMQLVSREMERVQKQFEAMLQQQKIDKEGYLKMTGLKNEQLVSQFKSEATSNLEDSLVFAEIAKAEKITLNDEDYNIEYEKLAKMYQQSVAEIKKVVPMTQIQIPMTNERVLNTIIKLN